MPMYLHSRFLLLLPDQTFHNLWALKSIFLNYIKFVDLPDLVRFFFSLPRFFYIIYLLAVPLPIYLTQRRVLFLRSPRLPPDFLFKFGNGGKKTSNPNHCSPFLLHLPPYPPAPLSHVDRIRWCQVHGYLPWYSFEASSPYLSTIPILYFNRKPWAGNTIETEKERFKLF